MVAEEEDEEGEEVDEELNELNRHMLPDIVISLEASQDWLVSQFKSFMTNHPDLFPFIGNQSNLDLLPSTTKPDHSIQDGTTHILRGSLRSSTKSLTSLSSLMWKKTPWQTSWTSSWHFWEHREYCWGKSILDS
uniref:Uncharacterized protein n=1 Tax=Cacopsylla melanoneura TaxID=428564 RepID=A0A8D9AZ15_9HEMI